MFLISYSFEIKDTGQTRKQDAAIQFISFLSKAEAIAKNALKGDQRIVDYRVENNDYEKNGETVYLYNVIIDDVAFDAPGKEQRDQFSSRSGN